MIPETYPIELLTVAQTRRADELTIAGGSASGPLLMEAAGEAVARAVVERTARGDRVGIACGPGNNGGDGFVAARRLAARGRRVDVALLGGRESLRGAAAAAAAGWPDPVGDAATADWRAHDLLVDALFGAGLARPLDGPAAAATAALGAAAHAGRPVIAVDLPSGVHGDSGALLGPAPKAAVTVTFFRLKPGHLLQPGRAHCGDLRLVSIGIEDSVLTEIAPSAFVNAPALWRAAFPWPGLAGHKYDRGHALVLSGEAFHTGAARLCARAALRIGAGLVTFGASEEALATAAPGLTAVMLAKAGAPDEVRAILADPRKNVVALGPGLGLGRSRALAEAALGPSDARRAFVLDADALVAFAGAAEALADIIGAAPGPVVLTPHEGEFARLFPQIPKTASKLERARRAARESGAVVLLKGSDTVVADPAGRAAIARIDAPFLATAGSGDVLTGAIAGLLAQGMPAWEAACAAAHVHAFAGAAFGPGLISEDLPELFPTALAALAG